MDVSRVHRSIHSKKGMAHNGHHRLHSSAAVHGVLTPQRSESADPGQISQSPDATALQPAEASASLRYKRTERMGLVIQTQEGDTVRLRFRTSERMKAAIKGGAEGGDAEVSLTARSNSKISMSVKGDLSADELAAIHETFNQATALADEFFSGGLSSAFASADALNIDSDQLARVSFKASVKQHLTYTSKGYAPTLPPQAPVEGEEPVGEVPAGPISEVPDAEAPEGDAPIEESPAQPVEGTPVEGTGEAPIELGAPEVGGFPDTVLPERSPVDEGEPVATDPVESEPAQNDPVQIIGDFLSRLAESLGANPEDGGTGLLDVSLKIRIFQSALITLSEVQPPEEPALPELVPETIDKVAELQQPPVDAVA